MLEEEGLFFLDPVCRLLFGDVNSELDLPHSSVHVCYKTYNNNYKGTKIGPGGLTFEDVINKEITPGKLYKK